MNYSVNKLITKGHCTVNVPVATMYITSYFLFDFNFVVLALTTIIAWLFWSFTIPKWKLSSLRNIASTTKYFDWNSKAIWNGLIWPDNYLMSKTEIWSKEDKIEYENLKRKFVHQNSDAKV